ncbi:penicillin-binding protein 2 [Kordiimonas aquimaris]|uniref:penicillin-binding protein 2 n=1 Tax=Kordiimonas aquimaris TaxID=707591 RepID=UPI0021D2BD07|nr:penicillin-binding protein 2 [Kordiimonas aquimaris]
MAREGLRYQAFSRRALIMAGLQGVAFTGLGLRLYYLSVVESEKYKLRADRNRISVRLIAPERGEIYDRNGEILATNVQDLRVLLVPEQTEDVGPTLAKVQSIVDLSDRRLSQIERRIKRQRKFVPVTLAQGLDWETFSRVNVQIPELPGIQTDAGLSRLYPGGNAIAHLVGYMASPDEDDIYKSPLYQLPGFKIGRQGLERRYEDLLRGGSGTRRVEVNAVGREIRELPPREEATRGNNLQLTLDMKLQQFVMRQLGEEAAGAVVMDLQDGDVLALASSPGYDPNEFSRGISNTNWQALLKDPRTPLLNKSVTGMYPPGSTIKMIIALAALEQGIIKSESEFYCNGRHRLGNNTFHCWRRQGHGKLNLVDAIAKSCDVYFYKIAEQMDIDDIAEMARRFGLGEIFNVGVDGEKEGLVPDREWKQVIQNQRWQLGETLNVAIGQGAMLATPLQLAVMTARLASTRKITPRLVANEALPTDSYFEPMDINPFHLQTVCQAMEKVMEQGGTAFDLRRPKSAAKLAGKTGTAQVRRISIAERQQEGGVVDNKDLPWQARDHALFVGYAPAENPKIAVSVIVQHGGGGSSVAAPLARSIIDEALKLYEQPTVTASVDEASS